MVFAWSTGAEVFGSAHWSTDSYSLNLAGTIGEREVAIRASYNQLPIVGNVSRFVGFILTKEGELDNKYD